ncbi:MAG: FG-GAP-like repeat-containing protein [Chitinophagales bacterium]
MYFHAIAFHILPKLYIIYYHRFFSILFFPVAQGQSISSIFPESGAVGSTVSINGSGFSNSIASNIVFFGATQAVVLTATDIFLEVEVPAGSNFQYVTVTNLETNTTAYSARPFIATTSCDAINAFSLAMSAQGGSHNVEICDMDGDGLADLIIPDYFNDYFTVTRNTSTPGSISFAPKVTFAWASGGQPNEVSIGDFDGDGKPDVALGGNGGGSFVSVYMNTSTPGSISFAARQDFTASTGQGNGNRIIDIDGDGKPDLLSVHWSGNCLWVLRNTSTGPGSISFAAGVSFSTTTQPHKIDVGDLDGDGKPDVVITAFTSNKLSIFRNTSTPGTISFAARQDFSPGTVPYFVHVGDLDGDQLADIAVVNRDVATLAVYRNTSTPGSISLAARQDFATPTGTFTHYGVAIGDLDGDAKPDVVVGNYTLNVTSIFKNTSSIGAISFATRIDVASGVSYDVGIDDFDGDTKPDLAVTNSGTTVSILANACTLLPVELIDFSAIPEGNDLILHWQTASEYNSASFLLDKSYDGVFYQHIAELAGYGNSGQEHTYTFNDISWGQKFTYYRLREMDLEGNIKILKTIAVEDYAVSNRTSIYPNPFTSYFIISGTQQGARISVFDLAGRLFYEQDADAGSTKICIPDLAAGVYIIQVEAGSGMQYLRVVRD